MVFRYRGEKKKRFLIQNVTYIMHAVLNYAFMIQVIKYTVTTKYQSGKIYMTHGVPQGSILGSDIVS